MAGDLQNAMALYEKAIVASTAHGFTQFAAISNERASRHLAKAGMQRQSDYYLKDAYNFYEQWTALGKCIQMKKNRPDIFGDKIVHLMGNTRTNLSTAALDYESLIKASNSISSKIKLNELIHRLMNVLLENAGAQRGVLMIPNDDVLFIVAEGISGPDSMQSDTGNIQSNINLPVLGSNKIPLSLILTIS